MKIQESFLSVFLLFLPLLHWAMYYYTYIFLLQLIHVPLITEVVIKLVQTLKDYMCVLVKMDIY